MPKRIGFRLAEWFSSIFHTEIIRGESAVSVTRPYSDQVIHTEMELGASAFVYYESTQAVWPKQKPSGQRWTMTAHHSRSNALLYCFCDAKTNRQTAMASAAA